MRWDGNPAVCRLPSRLSSRISRLSDGMPILLPRWPMEQPKTCSVHRHRPFKTAGLSVIAHGNT